MARIVLLLEAQTALVQALLAVVLALAGILTIAEGVAAILVVPVVVLAAVGPHPFGVTVALGVVQVLAVGLVKAGLEVAEAKTTLTVIRAVHHNLRQAADL